MYPGRFLQVAGQDNAKLQPLLAPRLDQFIPLFRILLAEVCGLAWIRYQVVEFESRFFEWFIQLRDLPFALANICLVAVKQGKNFAFSMNLVGGTVQYGCDTPTAHWLYRTVIGIMPVCHT